MLTSENLRRAADLQDQVAQLQNEINQLLAGQMVIESPSGSRSVTTASGKRKFSPEAIEKIKAAQRKRWKNVRKQKAAAAQAAQATQVAPAVASAPAAAPAPATPAPAPAPAPTPAPTPAQTKKGQLVAA